MKQKTRKQIWMERAAVTLIIGAAFATSLTMTENSVANDMDRLMQKNQQESSVLNLS